MLAALGRLIARRPGVVVLLWVLAVGGALAGATGVVGDGLFARLTSGEPTVPGEARTGQDLVSGSESEGPSLTLLLDGVAPDEAALAEILGAARTDLAGTGGVAGVADPLALGPAPDGSGDPRAAALTAADGDGLLVTVTLEQGLGGDAEEAALDEVHDRLAALGDEVTRAVPGASAQVGGITLLVEAITEQVEVDLRTGEGIALPVSLLVMVVVFGGFLAAGMPIAGALASIAGALASLLGFSYLIDLDATVVNVVTVLGLGLCIDYGLLMVSRFREELRRNLPRDQALRSPSPPRDQARRSPGTGDALASTLATAGRTVVFSAVTVAISLSGLLVFSADILRAIGAAGVSVVVVALLVALTLVPALLALAGHRMVRPGVPSRIPGVRLLVRRLGDVAPVEGLFSHLARGVQRRPWWVVLGVVVVLLGAAAPALAMQLRSSGTELLPAEAEQRQFFEALEERFPATVAPAVRVVADAGVEEVAAWSAEVAEIDGVRAVDPPTEAGDYTVLAVRVEGSDPNSQVATDVVRELRSDRPEFETWVTGQAAGLVDFVDVTADQAPWAVGVVVLATFVLLFAMTGSVLVPLKALLMNVVSLGASLGVLVWVFQEGHLEGLLGFTSAGGIETVIPPLVLAFGFGLAMDYEVFLLARVKELRDAGLSNDEAVVAGLQRSGRIITSAALIVVLVFSGFVVGELLVVKQTGVALAVAVAVDATLVRCLLVPATMTLLGEWNWWAPRPLRRLHDRLGLQH